MQTAGIYLILAAVAVRGILIFFDDPRFWVILCLLAAYGLLLVSRTWISHRKPLFLSQYSHWAYLMVQSILVILLLDISSYEDIFALLFVPLSLDAISFFGRRVGVMVIAAFSLAIISILLFSDEGRIFGLAMGALYSGICFLFGGYAVQVQKAEAAHQQNQHTFRDLQIAHRQLLGYADQVASLSIEHERNRLARDLHDSVTQTVFSMNLAVQSARILMEKDTPLKTSSPPGTKNHISDQLLLLEGLAEKALSEIQSLVSQLKPRTVTEEGLSNALRRLADERKLNEDMVISLEVCGDKTLSDAETLGLYFIAHEAITNIIKHSGVRAAIVRLNLDSSYPCLEIEDKGIGFDPGADPNQRGHIGLTGMSERAQEIGWNLSVESWRDQGTRIRVTHNQPRGVALDDSSKGLE